MTPEEAIEWLIAHAKNTEWVIVDGDKYCDYCDGEHEHYKDCEYIKMMKLVEGLLE